MATLIRYGDKIINADTIAHAIYCPVKDPVLWLYSPDDMRHDASDHPCLLKLVGAEADTVWAQMCKLAGCGQEPATKTNREAVVAKAINEWFPTLHQMIRQAWQSQVENPGVSVTNDLTKIKHAIDGFQNHLNDIAKGN